ncbi:MAG: chorismate-binding protein, partial [Spirochaetota bacterium]
MERNDQEFCAHALAEPSATHAQIVYPLDFDGLNSVAILHALQNEPHFFLLENATAEKTIARYSFFAYQMERKFRCLATPDGAAALWVNDFNREYRLSSDTETPLELLFRQTENISILSDHIWQGFQGGLVGMFGYEAVRHMGVLRKPLRRLSTPDSPYGQQPEMLFYEVHRFFVVDNANQRIFAAYLQPLASERDSPSLSKAYREGRQVLAEMVADLQHKLNSVAFNFMLPGIPSSGKSSAAELSRQLWLEDQSEEQQQQAIEQLREELIAGEGLQIVYSVGRKGPRVSPELFYRLLRRQNPSPYMFFFKDGEQHLIGSSPETHLSCQGGIACIKPIAGTRPLTRPLGEHLGSEELQAIIDDLLQDPKERSEHLMLIDLARNDLYTNCEADSVHTVKEFAPEVFSHVVHIVSEVQGRLRAGKKPYELFAKTFPAGTLSGAPKVRAMELIDQYEQSPR